MKPVTAFTNTRYRQEKTKEKGERALLIAVIDRALRDVGLLASENRQAVLLRRRSGFTWQPSPLDREFEDALQWLASNNRKEFSFLWIMAQLDWEWAVTGIRKKIKDSAL